MILAVLLWQFFNFCASRAAILRGWLCFSLINAFTSKETNAYSLLFFFQLQLDMTDFYDDDYDLDTEDDDQSVESFADGDDSGNGES